MALQSASGPVYGLCQRLTVRRHLAIATLGVSVVSMQVPLDALEIRVTQVRITGARLWAAVEVRDLLRDTFLTFVRNGRAIFVQLEADFWEDRRVVDRLVLSMPPVTWRVDGDADGRGVVLEDQYGGSLRHADITQPLSLRIDLGPSSRVEDAPTYYLHASLTAATVDERDIEDAGQAIFGDEQSARGLAGLGRFVFRTLLRMGKYFESATAEVTSRRLSGRNIRAGAF